MSGLCPRSFTGRSQTVRLRHTSHTILFSVPQLQENVQHLFAPELRQHTHRCDDDKQRLCRNAQGHTVLYGGFGAAKVRHDAQFVKLQVNEAVKKERSRRLRELDARQKEAYLTSCLGIPQTVLLEELFHAPDGKDYWMGHTTRYQKVLIEKEDGNAGELISVCPNRILFGEYLAE